MYSQFLNSPTDEIIMPSGNKSDACLPIIQTPTFERLSGNDAGKGTIAPDFDAALPEFEE